MQEYRKYIETCNGLLDKLADVKLPAVKPRWADFTDAGPGVGCSNFEVRFRDAEFAIFHNSDYRIRLHPSRDNSADNEAERTNSAIADSIVDGSTLQWEKYGKFDGLNDDEISKLTVSEYDENEKKKMEKNAWYCAEEIRKRIDGAPVFNDIIHLFLTERSNTFFFNKTYLVQYNTASSIPQKQSVPGYHCITKVMTFFEKHYHNGELYFEYIKEGCLETNQEPCDKCVNVEWVGPRCSRVPSPMPDPNNEGHYLPLSDTSTTTVNGDLRVIDGFAPRANIRKQFKK